MLILLLCVYFILHRSQPAKSWLKHSLLYLPIIHRLIKLHVAIRFCQTLATLLDANLALTSALQLCSQTLAYRPYQYGLQKTCEAIYQGQSFCTALTNTHLFPPLLLQMLAIGEQSQQLVSMLHYLSKHYEQQLSKQLAQLTKLIEPVFIIITGGLIGSLVIALYLPIFQLGHVI